MKTRLYNVFAEYKGKQTKTNAAPMTHQEACIFKSKFTDYPNRNLILVEVN